MTLASLLHANNVGTPSTLIDEVPGAAWTLSGGATQTAAGALYGAGSLDLSGNTAAASKYAKTTTGPLITTIGAGRLFTIEFSLKSSTPINFFTTILDTDQWFCGFGNFGAQIQFFGQTPPAFLNDNAFDGNRHDYAISRDGSNNYYFHQDGIYIGTFNANYGFGANTYVRIGSIDSNAEDPFDGLLDEIRVQWDVQLYGAADYTVSLPFTSGPGPVLVDLAVTDASDALSSTATVALTANLSVTDAADTVSSTATVLLVINLGVTDEDDILTSVAVTQSSEVGAEVWNYILPNGLSAGATVAAIHAVLTGPIEGSIDLSGSLRVLLAVAAGKTTITPTAPDQATVEFRAVDDSVTRVTAEMDGSERVNVTIDPLD